MKLLIVNADDFGRSLEINRGIVSAYREGILSGASLMVNFDAFEHAVKKSQQYGLPLGLHLNLTEGRPLSSTHLVSSLVKSDGHFFSKELFFLYYFSGKFKKKHIETELRAQVRKAKKAGILLDHCDSHHHIHLLPGITEFVNKLCFEYKISHIRFISQPKWSYKYFFSNLAQFVLSLLSRNTLDNSDGKSHFFGFELMLKNSKIIALKDILSNLPDGVSELMCHPGYLSKNKIGFYNSQRCEELKALVNFDIKQYIKSQNIKLVSFSNL